MMTIRERGYMTKAQKNLMNRLLHFEEFQHIPISLVVKEPWAARATKQLIVEEADLNGFILRFGIPKGHTSIYPFYYLERNRRQVLVEDLENSKKLTHYGRIKI